MLDHPGAAIVPLLSEGAVDLAVDSRSDTPEWISSRLLFRSFMVTLARSADPALKAAGISPGDRIPPEVFCAVPQVLMSMDGARTGTVDQVLESRGLTRHVMVTVPLFHAVALAVAEAGLLGNVLASFAARVGPLLGLETYRPPYDPPLVDVMLVLAKTP